MEERELEEDDKEVKEDKDKEDKKDKEVKVAQGSCLVVVRPDGSSLLLRAEVNFHLLFKTCSIIFTFKLLRAEVKFFSLFLSPVMFKSTSFF